MSSCRRSRDPRSPNHPTVISLQSGTLLACWARGALADSVYSSSKPLGGTWSTAAIVGSGLWSKENTPCLLQLDSGRVLLFGWASDDAANATVRLLYSDDDGATWATSSSGCLPASISLDGATGYTIRSIRVAAEIENGNGS